MTLLSVGAVLQYVCLFTGIIALRHGQGPPLFFFFFASQSQTSQIQNITM
jgi:hypothetical protein